MRNAVALITVAATAALFLHPAQGIAQGWSTVMVDRQPPVTGNGQIVTQQRPIGNFRHLEARGASDVTVRVGPAPSLTITADSNIIGLIGSDIRGSKLILDAKGSYRTRRTPRIVVTVPALEAAALSGSGDMRVEGMNARVAALAINGSGNLVASGRASSLNVAINGSGNADARAFPAANTQVAISGSGNATVSTSGTLNGAISGSGNIRYLGRPSSISVVRNGSGNVVPVR